MRRAPFLFVVGVCATLLAGLPAWAQSPADVTLTRIDCGTGATPTDVGRFSDTFAYKDLKLTFWDQITSPTPMQGANVAGFKSWISENRPVEPLTGDKDVFGDGSVIVLRMPGHTPGHSGLLVRLKDMGPVLLTGDLVHFRENYDSGGVPHFNFDRAATVASIERMKQIVANLKATVVIQHDMRDIGKLPAFPQAAK